MDSCLDGSELAEILKLDIGLADIDRRLRREHAAGETRGIDDAQNGELPRMERNRDGRKV